MGKRLPRKCQTDINTASGIVHKIKKPKETKQQKKRLDKLVLLKVMKSMNPEIKKELHDSEDELDEELQRNGIGTRRPIGRGKRGARGDDVCRSETKIFTFESKNILFPTNSGHATGWQATCDKAEKFFTKPENEPNENNSSKVIEVVKDSYESDQISLIVDRLDVEKGSELHEKKVSILAKAFNRINQVVEIDPKTTTQQSQRQQQQHDTLVVTIDETNATLTSPKSKTNANKKFTIPTSTPIVGKKVVRNRVEESPILSKRRKRVCKTCKFTFENINEKTDADEHDKFHAYFLSFYWNVVDTEVTNTISKTMKIEKIVPNHPKAWKLLRKMLKSIDEIQLSAEDLNNLNKSTGFIMLDKSIVYGILLAKECDFGFKMLDMANGTITTEKQRVHACVYFIWVYKEKRNQKIATNLLNAFRTSYKTDIPYLLNEDFAFSLQTIDAKGFLAAYFRNMHYFVTN